MLHVNNHVFFDCMVCMSSTMSATVVQQLFTVKRDASQTGSNPELAVAYTAQAPP